MHAYDDAGTALQRESSRMEHGSSRTNPGEGRLYQEEVTERVIGSFYSVYNELRFGFLESAYAGALAVEMQRKGLKAKREELLQVRYHEHVVGVYRADFIVEGTIILELKTMAKIGHPEKRQLLHYLRATDMRLGLVLNFGPEATFLRVINT